MPKKVTRLFALLGDPNGHWEDGLQMCKNGHELYKSVQGLLEAHGLSEKVSKLPEEWQEKLAAFERGEVNYLQLPASKSVPWIPMGHLVSFTVGA